MIALDSLLKRKDKLPHALLFVGAADLLGVAQKLEAPSRVAKEQGNLFVLEPESGKVYVSVEQVRKLIYGLSLQSWSLGKKRYILLPRAEQLLPQAANILLKTLEEPGEGVVFLLSAPTRASVLPTVLSRCVLAFVPNESNKEKLKVQGANPFFQAFRGQGVEALLKLPKEERLESFGEGKALLKEVFFEEAFSGEVSRAKWFELFDFLEEVEQKLETHMDLKWVAASIKRRGLYV